MNHSFMILVKEHEIKVQRWLHIHSLVFVRVTRSIALQSIAVSVPLGILAGLVGSWTLLRRDVLALLGR